jgi:lipoate-protein ligase A
MISRGVQSVRSPVCNLRQFNPDVDHLSFTNAVVKEFRGEYGIDEEVRAFALFNGGDPADIARP